MAVSGDEARCGPRSAPPPPESLEAGAVPAKKRLGLDDAQDVSPGRRDGGECDQDDAVQPRHARPGDRALQHGELVSEQGDLSEQRPARAKGVHHGGSEQKDGLEHGWRKGTPLEFSLIREVAGALPPGSLAGRRCLSDLHNRAAAVLRGTSRLQSETSTPAGTPQRGTAARGRGRLVAFGDRDAIGASRPPEDGRMGQIPKLLGLA